MKRTKLEDDSARHDGESPGSANFTDGGKYFLDIISNLGIDCIFYNSGSDYYPILEHMSELEQAQEKPRSILCLSEQTALGMAHGYAMISKKAQLVLVHAGIGTLQFGGALHNAYRGRAPVLIASGRAPFTFENELPGSKDSPHHWDQELYDQAGSLREYTKWQYELRSNFNLAHVVNRAIQIANTEPQGPVYLILPRELLAERIEPQKVRSPAKYQVPDTSVPDPESLEKMADLLLGSESPIIITEYLGRNERAISRLVRLSELLSIGVLELSRRRTNFPTTHPNYLPTFPKEELESADLICLFDVDVPWIPSSQKLRADAKIIQIDMDPIKSRYPLWGFPVNVSSGGSSEIALARLVEIIEEKTSSQALLKDRIRDRASKLELRHNELRTKLSEIAASVGDRVRVESALAILNSIKNPDSLVVNEGVSYTKTVENYIDTTMPSTFFGLGGSSLGDGIANALGLKLASPDKDVICVTGDGSFIYSNPLATLCASSQHQLPIVTILINNGGYIAMKRSVDKFYPDGISKRTNHYAGVRIEPEPDYVAVAKACGGAGWKIEATSELESALQNALRETRSGRSALVELVLERS